LIIDSLIPSTVVEGNGPAESFPDQTLLYLHPGIGGGIPPSVRELQELGVARLSLGSGLMKATLSLIKRVADELSEKGTYDILMGTLTPLPQAAMAYTMAIGLNK
jgi:hypothetical protein